MKYALVLLGIALALFLVGAVAQGHGYVSDVAMRRRPCASCAHRFDSHAHDDDDDDGHGHDHDHHGHSHGGASHSHSHSAPAPSGGKYDPPKPATPSVFFEPFDDAWSSRWVRPSPCAH